MKKLFIIISLLPAALSGSAVAQCTSSASLYDLIVTGNVALAPSATQFLNGYVCTGATLLDSTTCCTRFIHVETGGTYEAGPMAYGFVYLKSGATFDAHGNTNFFGVAYEAGAVILNYTGPQTLCAPVTFPSANCATGIAENQTSTTLSVYPNPASGMLTIRFPEKLSDAVDVVIINALGEKVLGTHISNFSSAASVDVYSLKPALYFYSIIQNKSVISSGKILVE